MNIRDIIIRKRDGFELSEEEISFFMTSTAKGSISDYQISAFCMAIYFSGMSAREMRDFTLFMSSSGDKLDLSVIEGLKVDKHSTGGVGDSISLVLGPILASEGICFAKMAGRSLGHTGGTIDKLQSIPNFNVNLSKKAFYDQLQNIKIAITSQTENIAPIDKQLYAIRDTSGSVESIPLIASSIMSKKLAVGADFILLDVKVGEGAFMKSLKEARELANSMVDIAKSVEIPCIAAITDMSQPLCDAVGNVLEVKRVIETLQGKGSTRLRDLSVLLAALTFVNCKISENLDSAIVKANEAIDSGEAFSVFKAMVALQGGDVSFIDDPSKFVLGKYTQELKAENKGYIAQITPSSVGHAVMELGAGRKNKDDLIDLSVGVTLNFSVGDKVEKNETLAKIYASDEEKLQRALIELEKAFLISDEFCKPQALIQEVIS